MSLEIEWAEDTEVSRRGQERLRWSALVGRLGASFALLRSGATAMMLRALALVLAIAATAQVRVLQGKGAATDGAFV